MINVQMLQSEIDPAGDENRCHSQRTSCVPMLSTLSAPTVYEICPGIESLTLIC